MCVACPELAIFADVPLALTAAAEEAPSGANILVHAALDLGADEVALSPLLKRLPPLLEAGIREGLLLSRDQAISFENSRHQTLAELGIDVKSWIPADVQVPTKRPPHHRLLSAHHSGNSGTSGCGSLVKRGKDGAHADVKCTMAPPPPPKRRRRTWRKSLGSKINEAKMQDHNARPPLQVVNKEQGSLVA